MARKMVLPVDYEREIKMHKKLCEKMKFNQKMKLK